MAIALYMDHQVPRAITVGLRLRDVDVITAFEDSANELNALGVTKMSRKAPQAGGLGG